jgi:2-polyprenyl-3-methyl-5-hydroxy-6-metoxy-1,4-benzoquinol methylase
MAVTELDTAKADAFGSRMLATVNGGMLALAIGLGQETGLYEALGAAPGPATSAEIAERAGLDERYVREWLAGQLAGGIVEYDDESGTWHLPPEHAAVLTDAAGPNNLAFLSSGIARFADLEDDVLAVFRSGGGVPWTRMVRLQQWQAELGRRVYHGSLDPVLAQIPGLVERLREGVDVLDAGCGHGHVALLVADRFPASRVSGYDQAETSIDAARAEAARLGLRNATFAARDVGAVEPEVFDVVIAFDVIHDLAHPYEALRTLRASLRPGGVLVLAEHALSQHPEENVGHPFAAALYTVSLFHCMTASLSEDGEGLGIAWGDGPIRAALAEAGFARVEPIALEHDPLNAFYAAWRDVS